MTLGEWLKVRGMSPDQFANKLGVHRATVYRDIANGCPKSRAPQIVSATKGEVTYLEALTGAQGNAGCAA
jgi:transposase